MFTNPSVADFKAYFVRDFQYGATVDKVMDADITKAYGETAMNFNSALWPDQASYTMGYLYLTAHFLVMDLRASSQGVRGQYNFPQANKSVGNVSEGYAIPPQITDHPVYSMLSKTYYGAKYLFLVLPQLTGNIVAVCGSTQP